MRAERVLRRRPYYASSKLCKTGLNVYPKRRRTGWGIPLPEPQMDWGELRRLKVRCERQCAEFDPLSGACRFALLPDLECASFRFGGFSEGVEGAEGTDAELVCMMSSQSKSVV